MRALPWILLLACAAVAEAAPTEWTRCMNARIYRVAELGSDTIVSGEYYGGGDLGDGKARGPRAVYVARYDARGGLVWAHAIEGRVDIGEMVVAADGAVAIAGVAYEPIDFGAGTTRLVSSYQDVWIASLAADGKLRWAKRFGGSSGYGEIRDLAVTGDGVEAVAVMDAGTDFGGGPVGKPGPERTPVRIRFAHDGKLRDAAAAPTSRPVLIHRDAGEAPHVVSLDYARGAHHWQAAIDNSGRGIDGFAEVGPSGDVLVGGSFEYELELAPGHRLSTPGVAPFVAAFDPDGHVRWTSILGRVAGHDLAWVDEIGFHRGRILVGGVYTGTLSIAGAPVPSIPNPPTLTDTIGDHDGGFIAALGDDGKPGWARAFPARIRRIAAGEHLVVVYGHGAGPDQQCLAHDPPLPD